MAAFSDYLEEGILNYTLRGQSLTQPTTIYVALFTADPTDANTTANEVDDSAYARQDAADGGAIATGWTAPSVSGSGHVSSNANALEFPPIADGSITVTHFGLYDASTGGNLLYHGEFDTSRTLQVDDVVSVAVGALTITLE